jgi:hypothetical protein
VFVVVVASRRGFVIVLSLCEDKTSFPPPLFSLWILDRKKIGNTIVGNAEFAHYGLSIALSWGGKKGATLDSFLDTFGEFSWTFVGLKSYNVG